jgi:hypothetical protein
VENEQEQNQNEEAMFRLSLEGDGISVKKDITEVMALQVLSVVLGGSEQPVLKRSPSIGPTAAPSAGQRSLREFMDEVEARRNPEKIVAIGQFIVEQTGQDTFTREEVKGKFRSAGERTPANFSRDFAVVMAAGWIAEDPGSGEFYVTNRGREALAQRFSAEARRPALQARRARRRRRTASEADE